MCVYVGAIDGTRGVVTALNLGVGEMGVVVGRFLVSTLFVILSFIAFLSHSLFVSIYVKSRKKMKFSNTAQHDPIVYCVTSSKLHSHKSTLSRVAESRVLYYRVFCLYYGRNHKICH